MEKNRSAGIRNLPNFITALRILGSASLLFIEPFSSVFFIVYTLSGFSDVLDGFIARRFNLTSPLGARLDSIADLLFYAVMVLRIFPRLWEELPVWIWYIVAVIILLRIASYVTAAVKYHCFASLHTYMNKVTGAAVFCIPFFMLAPWPVSVALCLAACAIAAFSTVEELMMHLISKEYHEGVKSIFALRKNV